MKITMKAVAYTAVGAAVVGVTAGAAAPLIGAWVGSTFLGLSGAAATSAGLATLGGSLAAGGLGMAGGTTVVSLAGAVGGAGVGALGAKVTSVIENNKTRLCVKCIGGIGKDFKFCPHCGNKI